MEALTTIITLMAIWLTFWVGLGFFFLIDKLDKIIDLLSEKRKEDK